MSRQSPLSQGPSTPGGVGSGHCTKLFKSVETGLHWFREFFNTFSIMQLSPLCNLGMATQAHIHGIDVSITHKQGLQCASYGYASRFTRRPRALFLQRQSQLHAQSSCHSGTVLGPQSHLALQCVKHLLSEGGLEGSGLFISLSLLRWYCVRVQSLNT